MTEGNLDVRVVGVGGAGCNAVRYVEEKWLAGIRVAGLDTDARNASAPKLFNCLALPGHATRELGSGGDVGIAAAAARASERAIRDALVGADMVFVVAGLGGGTGSGAAPVVGDTAKRQGSLAIGLVSVPFVFEGARRRDLALEAVGQLEKSVDCLVAISCDSLALDAGLSLERALRVVDRVFMQAVEGVVGPLGRSAFPKISFPTLRALLSNSGRALVGFGEASGQARARDAAEAAVSGGTLSRQEIGRAAGLLVSVAGDESLKVREAAEAERVVAVSAGWHTGVITSSFVEPNIRAKVRVSVLATGVRG